MSRTPKIIDKKRFEVLLPSSLLSRIEKDAVKKQASKSEIIREILQEYYGKNKQSGNGQNAESLKLVQEQLTMIMEKVNRIDARVKRISKSRRK